jgi:hypothetical protein
LCVIDEEGFDALPLGPDVADAWPTAAYERVTEMAGPIPIIVYTDSIEAMALIKRQQERRRRRRARAPNAKHCST